MQNGSVQITRALLSVTDKSGLLDLARALVAHNVELISTGGTHKALAAAGLPVKEISELTGFPEMLDGRVKTLHPRVHGGLLYKRNDPNHVEAISAHGILPIDLVVVNLYAFEKTAADPKVSFGHLIENIDIGGPSMVRSAAKNFEHVAIVTNPAAYPELIAELNANSGALTRATRWRLARNAFALTAAYDSAIATTLEQIASAPSSDSGAEFDATTFPAVLRLQYPLAQSLRYGENPHQRAALYVDGSGLGVAAAHQIQGKELSFNNFVDLDACWQLAQEFDEPGVAIIKHTNPCGAATGATILEAYQKALAADPVSAFGSVIGINRIVDATAAEEIAKLFVEAIAAPGFTPEAITRFAVKKNLRLVEIKPAPAKTILRHVSGGLLMQDADSGHVQAEELITVTKRQPTDEELHALLFAWRVAKHVKSNAIVYARNGQTVGVGAGQMSRVDAAKFGAQKAILPLAGTVAASDAFFPFPDGLEVVVNAGATAVIQPGGSVKDQDVIAAADKHGIAMLFTGMRHFKH